MPEIAIQCHGEIKTGQVGISHAVPIGGPSCVLGLHRQCHQRPRPAHLRFPNCATGRPDKPYRESYPIEGLEPRSWASQTVSWEVQSHSVQICSYRVAFCKTVSFTSRLKILIIAGIQIVDRGFDYEGVIYSTMGWVLFGSLPCHSMTLKQNRVRPITLLFEVGF